jgi:NRPS condensation-like uncharacterized protein
MEVHLAGRLDPERLLSAARAACERHPLARAHMISFEPGDRTYEWQIQDDATPPPLEVVDCVDEPALALARARFLEMGPPLEAAPPFRLLLAHRAQGDALMMVLNHAVCDGTGAWRILVSLLRSYAGVEDPVPDFDPLTARDLRPLVVPDKRRERLRRLSRLPAVFVKASVPECIAPDGGQAPGLGAESDESKSEASEGGAGPGGGAVADRDSEPQKSADPGEGVYPMAFDERETAVLEARRVEASTLNDVMLGGLVLAVRRWNAEHGARRGKICVTVPVNLRPPSWSEEVIGNFASLMPVAVPKGAPDGLDELIAVVTKGTQKAKRNHTANAMFDLIPSITRRLSLERKRGYGSREPETLERLQDTAVLSNLGRLALPDLGQAGPVRGAWMFPPARFTRGFAIGALSVGGRLQLGLRYQRAFFNEEGAAAFASLYRSVLLGEDESDSRTDMNRAR